MKDYLSHAIAYLYLSTDLTQFYGIVTVFGYFGSFTVFTILFFDFQLFWPEYWLFEIHIWCINIGIVLVLHRMA
jgi:hypothetical protein